MAWQRTRIELPEGFSTESKERIGQLIIDRIVERTLSGEGIRSNGRIYSFPGYTKEYRKFKGQSSVDLELSGDMLSEIKLLSIRGNSVLIGYENGTEANAKAEGNQIGSYGRSPNPRKARSFLGINKEELKAILSEVEE